MATTNFKGQPVKLIGEFIQVGKVERPERQKCDSKYFSKSGYQCLCNIGTQI